jgi:hypothetical protein
VNPLTCSSNIYTTSQLGVCSVSGSLLGSKSVTVDTTRASCSYPKEKRKVVILQDIKVVASYSPLVPTCTVSGETVISIGSDRQLAWTGGPQPWPLKPANYFKDLIIVDQTLVKVSPVTHPSLHVYEVTCPAVGDTKLTRNPMSSTMTIHYSKPHTISLTPSISDHTDTTLPPCPLKARQGRIAVQSDLDLKFLVIIKDVANRVIDSGSEHGMDGSLSVRIELVEDAATETADLELSKLENGSGVSKNGSGFFTLKQDEERLEATYTTTTSVIPVGTGSTAMHLVSGMASLVLEVKDKVEVGSSIIATPTLLYSDKRPLPLSYFDHNKRGDFAIILFAALFPNISAAQYYVKSQSSTKIITVVHNGIEQKVESNADEVKDNQDLNNIIEKKMANNVPSSTPFVTGKDQTLQIPRVSSMGHISGGLRGGFPAPKDKTSEVLWKLAYRELSLTYKPDPIMCPEVPRKVELPEDKLKADIKERLVASLVAPHKQTELRVNEIYRLEDNELVVNLFSLFCILGLRRSLKGLASM